MTANGALSHIDISVGYPERSIPFYDALLSGLGYSRMVTGHPGFGGPHPRRAWWSLTYADGSRFGIEVRPADDTKRDRRYDRYAPGPHHLAFHANNREVVDKIYRAMLAIDADILDPPVDYSGQSGYGEGYYAVFIADPDGVKLEVVHQPQAAG
jgi:catechol 2,3-dioxygenase-like lactoylglutathione lyase family enzyme